MQKNSNSPIFGEIDFRTTIVSRAENALGFRKQMEFHRNIYILTILSCEITQVTNESFKMNCDCFFHNPHKIKDFLFSKQPKIKSKQNKRFYLSKRPIIKEEKKS